MVIVRAPLYYSRHFCRAPVHELVEFKFWHEFSAVLSVGFTITALHPDRSDIGSLESHVGAGGYSSKVSSGSSILRDSSLFVTVLATVGCSEPWRLLNMSRIS